MNVFFFSPPVLSSLSPLRPLFTWYLKNFFFGCVHSMWKFPGQGLNQCHSSDLSRCSDHARSLILCATRELLFTWYFKRFSWLEDSLPPSFSFFFLNWSLVSLQCCVVSDVQWSDSDIHIDIFFRFFSITGYYETLNIVPVVYSRALLFICFICSSLYLLIPDS